jgi:histidinol phosphatase-like PHP family hydrolase
VAKVARKAGAKLVINTDTHTPDNLITKDFASTVLYGAGIEKKEAEVVFKNSKDLACKVLEG